MRSPIHSAPPTPPGQTPSLSPPPRWLRAHGNLGGHAQTLWTALYAKTHTAPLPAYRRERWTTPDHDFIDVDWLDTPTSPENSANSTNPENPANNTAPQQPPTQPLLVLFHGLEGTSQSHYALAMADWCVRNGWAYAVPHFRSCSGTVNHAPRLYHMGDYEEADWILKRIKQRHAGPVVVMGVSLGGNVALRWAIETGAQAAQTVSAVAGICAPLDLIVNAQRMDTGFCKWIYTNMFLRTMRKKCETKIQQYPNLFDIQAVRRARTFAEFDELITAPLHGFKGHMDYWARSSITPDQLDQIRIPALVLNPLNDPFIPAHSLPAPVNSDYITYARPENGGHLGFASGAFPGNLLDFAQTIGAYLQHHCKNPSTPE